MNGKVTRWSRYLKNTKKDELQEISYENFRNIFQEKYMSERFFDCKVKEFHELRMGSMIMDTFTNIFLYLLHYVPYIKEEKVKIQQFLGCLPPRFRDRLNLTCQCLWILHYTRPESTMSMGSYSKKTITKIEKSLETFTITASLVQTHSLIESKITAFKRTRTSTKLV